jgi:hypothetical protein
MIAPAADTDEALRPKEFDMDLGRFRIANTPKFLEDGLQNDFLFGFFYTNALKLAGDIRVRYINGSEDNVKWWDIDDSMLSRSRRVCEVFLLPVNYYFFRGSGFTIHAGAGLYYDFNKLNENGYFNDSALFDPPGEDRYNAYTNDFTAHAVGPLVDAGMSYKLNYENGFFYSALSAGSVPVFYLNRKQTWKLLPMMNPVPTYSVASESSCSPYFYASLDVMLNLKNVSLFASLLAEYSRLRYTAAGFTDETGEWADVEEETENKVMALEISLLIHLGESGILPQIGYGRKFDAATGGGNYLLLGARKEWF